MWCFSEEEGALCYVLELRGVFGVCGEAASGLSWLDRLSWDETPWKRERVSRLSPSCKLLGLCCLSGETWDGSGRGGVKKKKTGVEK